MDNKYAKRINNELALISEGESIALFC